MSRMTLMTVAAVFGMSLAASANAADYWAPTPVWSNTSWSNNTWPNNSWTNNNYQSNSNSWSTNAQREEMHRRYLTPAEHDALHRGMGHNTQYQARNRSRSPYNSYGPAAAYDVRYTPNDRSRSWPTWPLPAYQFNSNTPYLNGYGR